MYPLVFNLDLHEINMSVSEKVNDVLISRLDEWLLARDIARLSCLSTKEVNQFLYNEPSIRYHYTLETKSIKHGKWNKEKPHYRIVRKKLNIDDMVVLVAFEKLSSLNAPISKTDLYELTLNAILSSQHHFCVDIGDTVNVENFWMLLLTRISVLLKPDQILNIQNDCVCIKRNENKRVLFSIGNAISSVACDSDFEKFFHIVIDNKLSPPFSMPLRMRYIHLFLNSQTKTVWNVVEVDPVTITAILGAMLAMEDSFHIVVVDNKKYNLKSIVDNLKSMGEKISLYEDHLYS